ncbi:sulfur carrier protein ThiS [Microlunatus panaciterrae]|uniref:Sulfur carrier protein n=1 Tax=Microlunatus panaciterrae TaxID=400768 RepID=A0ABS2RMF4_9ACTN|nr:sulfur carrier protein ThiS [Microlunatus panaciterrae]MBM7800175.1 sulfur carrier protein [Microlunatus panaciterrae]
MIIYVNGEERSVSDDATLIDVLGAEVENGEPRRGIAVAVDGAVVPRRQLTGTELRSGTRVEIVTAVQGG